MSITLFLIACLGRVFFALARSALINMRRPRLLELEQKGVASARAIQHLTENSGKFLATAEVGALLSLVFASGISANAFSSQVESYISAWRIPYLNNESIHLLAFFLVMMLTAFVLFILGRLVPEAIAVRYTEPIALALVRPMQAISVMLTPLVKFAVVVSNLLSIPFGGQKRESASLVTEAEIKTMVDAGGEEGLIEDREKEMILSVLDFGDTVAREVMVPRIDVDALEVDTPFDEALDVVIRAGHSRVPVYKETIDEIVGILYAKDLLRSMRDRSKPQTVAALVRPVTFTPESKRVNELLQELQKTRVHVCIVVDEYGGTAGLVTIEDILEEIVGEIQDEYDIEEPESAPLPDGKGYLLDAGMNIDDVNELLKVKLATSESDTLGGFIYDQLGKVPVPGEIVQHENLRLEVLSVKDRRILKIKVTYAQNEKNKDAEPQTQSEETKGVKGNTSPQTI
jgi:putative hemolysin